LTPLRAVISTDGDEFLPWAEDNGGGKLGSDERAPFSFEHACRGLVGRICTQRMGTLLNCPVLETPKHAVVPDFE
jgi:hypothetical protein